MSRQWTVAEVFRCWFDELTLRCYAPLQQQVLKLLQGVTLQQDANGEWVFPADFIDVVKNDAGIQALGKNDKKEAMAFASFQMRVRGTRGAAPRLRLEILLLERQRRRLL